MNNEHSYWNPNVRLNFNEKSIVDRYSAEIASTSRFDVNGNGHLIWQKGLSSDNKNNVGYIWIINSFFWLLGIHMALGLMMALMDLISITISMTLDGYLNNYLFEKEHWFLIAVFIFIYQYNFQKKHTIKCYEDAAKLYFCEGIHEAFRQLYICKEGLKHQDFKILLDERFKHESKMDLIEKKYGYVEE